MTFINIFAVLLLSPIVIAYHNPFYASNQYSNSALYNFRSNNFISPTAKERLQKGLMSPRELDKLFSPTKAESDSFLKISSSGWYYNC